MTATLPIDNNAASLTAVSALVIMTPTNTMGQLHWPHGLQLTPLMGIHHCCKLNSSFCVPTDDNAASATSLDVTIRTTASNMEAEVVMMVAGMGVEGHPNGPQDNKVRALILRLVLIDDEQVQGACNDALLKVIEQSVEAPLDNKECVSNNESNDKEDYTDNSIHIEAWCAVDAILEDLCQHQVETATGSAGEPQSAADETLERWNDHTALHTACVKLSERRDPREIFFMSLIVLRSQQWLAS